MITIEKKEIIEFLTFCKNSGLNLTIKEDEVVGEPVKQWDESVIVPVVSYDRMALFGRNKHVICRNILESLLEWNKTPNPFEIWDKLTVDFFGKEPEYHVGLFDEGGLFRED